VPNDTFIVHLVKTIMIPATGWVSDRQGKVTIVAQNSNVSSSRLGDRSIHCQQLP
jgi:hypothetical protein